MDKYKLTAGLNYLKENSYKGDGSPGMVMGIASDARSDTNTYEGKGPTTSSKHSSERELKKYDPFHGHTKPEGGNPQVCNLCKGEGCEPCGHTGEMITKLRNDPKVDEGKTHEECYEGCGCDKTVDEGAISRHGDELIDELKSWTEQREMNEFENWEEFLDAIHSQVPSSFWGDTAKMLEKVVWQIDDGHWDYIIANRDPEDGQVFEDIMRLAGLTENISDNKTPTIDSEMDAYFGSKPGELEEAKRKARPDDDDDEEEKPEDPEKDKVQHILMQLRKAQDVDGDHPIKFLDGSEHKLPLKDINLFMDKYMNMKPLDREKMQQVAIMSKDKFDTILTFFKPKHGKLEKSIY